MGRLVYGLDLGINNVGWAAVRKSDREVEILAMGTFVFDSPLSDENDPSEGLKSKIRGQKRRARRTARRRHQRKMSLYRLLADHGLLPSRYPERVALLCAQTEPYSLRAKGLREKLEPFEFGRVLCHLNQHRGFLSPRDLMLFGIDRFDDDEPEDGEDPQAKEEDTGRIRSEIKRTREEMQGFETIGAFLHDRLKQGKPVRKKKVETKLQKEENERRFVRADRHMVKDEFDLLWQRQAHHHPILTHDLKEKVERIIFNQRLLAADPKTRGNCTFYKKELRMPRASLTAQKFVIAQDVAHLEVTPSPTADARKLMPHERALLVERLLQGEDLPWAIVKDLLRLPPTAMFNIEPGKGRKKGTSGTKEKLRGSQTVARVRRILGAKWDQLDAQAQRELVGEIVSIRDWVGGAASEPAALRRRKLFLRKAYGPQGVRFTEREANELASIDLPEGYLTVSLRAAKRILPHLLTDKVYSEACAAAGFDHANPDGPGETLDRLPYPTEADIPHAVVRASVRSAVRVLNALHRGFGKPDAIHIELPRDLAKGAKQREEDETRMREREKERREIAKRLVEVGIKPNRENVRMVQLWEELGGAGLAMEPEVVISDLEDLFEGPYDVCHIVPRGHGLDNGMGNLFLGTEHFNRVVQGNRTPYEALGQDPQRWALVCAHVKSLKSMSPQKRARLLAKERPEDFTGRHLAATGWLSREVLKLAQRMVAHKPDALVVPGRATGEFRRFWELDDLIPLHPVEQAAEDAWREFLAKVEEGRATEDDVKNAKPPRGKARSNYKHHALDALVVALTDRASLQAMATYQQLKDAYDPRWVDKARRKAEKAQAMPDPDLRAKAEHALANAVVVHRPRRRPSGELHKEMPKSDGLRGAPPGKPWSTAIVGKHLVKYDGHGRPAQAYPLENNHHVVVWERTEPNARGQFERRAEVVPTIEAVRRRDRREPVIRKHSPRPGWRFVMALCKGDMVELADGQTAVVSKFYAPEEGRATLALWQPFAAAQLGKINAQNPYLVRNLGVLSELAFRVVLNPLGHVVYREGARE